MFLCAGCTKHIVNAEQVEILGARAHGATKNSPEQLPFCIVAFRDPENNTILLAVSYGHLFARAADRYCSQDRRMRKLAFFR